MLGKPRMPLTPVHRLFSATKSSIRKYSTTLSTMRACQISKQGISAVELQISDICRPVPTKGQILVKNSYAGLNFIDTYFRSGLYKKEVPFTLGVEGSGVVEEAAQVDLSIFGKEKSFDLVGKRVGYFFPETYAEYAVVDASKAFLIPDGVSEEVAIACCTQGMTAQMLAKDIGRLSSGMTCLVHACAGGTGQLLAQMAKNYGAKVIGTCSTGKLEVVDELTNNACNFVIDYSEEDVVERINEITNGKGVNVVFDGVGKSTFESSLDSVAKKGLVVFFGNASGPVPPIDPLVLSQKGSIFITRPTLFDYTVKPGEFQARADEVLEMVAAGNLKVTIDKIFELEEANKAHEYIEGGSTKGKVVIKI